MQKRKKYIFETCLDKTCGVQAFTYDRSKSFFLFLANETVFMFDVGNFTNSFWVDCCVELG